MTTTGWCVDEVANLEFSCDICKALIRIDDELTLILIAENDTGKEESK
jgi:hypothetical protein